ncbi:MAG: M1 family metallopeptidase [Ginsengibacter sp.]
MKKRTLLLIQLVLVSQLLPAQQKEINSFEDLPALRYATAALKSGDTAKVDEWMKKTAAIELKHCDSMLNQYNVSDISARIFLLRTRALCEFITANWKDLQHADTVFSSIANAYPPFKKAGITELSAYAKAKLEAPGSLNQNYISFFTENMKKLTADENAFFTSSSVKLFNDANEVFETELKKVAAVPVIADTSMGQLFRGYVYRQIDPVISEQLSAYVNKIIQGKFTRADTLRGSITPGRAWWNVLHYAITVKPDFTAKTISGSNEIKYEVVSDSLPAFMQIDLQEPLLIDSILFNDAQKLAFTKDGNVWHVAVPGQEKSSVGNVLIYYHGMPRKAVNPPWDGGWIWTRDSLGNPWMSAACQGLGASVWYPCKDIQSDEPDSGASLTMIVPDTLIGVANGRLYSKKNNGDGTASYSWKVVNPINNYDIIPYIGKYVNYSEVYDGEKGKLDVSYWVLNYNLDKAKEHMVPEVHRMLKSHEYWMGPYPFYEDGYKLVDAPYLGMEHQSAIAYGNKYMNGYLGQDLSGSGWGLKWDYIIVHESGHEWFGNNITTNDIADMWVHEGFTSYSETLFTEYYYGKEAGNEYTVGIRNGIQNIFPVIGYYGVNDDVSARNGDMYNKGSNLLQTIRHSIHNDSLFREILRGLNTVFYHQAVTSLQVEKYISDQAHFSFSRVFNQYVRKIQIPQLEIYITPDGKSVSFRYANCINGFNLPLFLKHGYNNLKIFPGTEWKTVDITGDQAEFFNAHEIEKMYYIGVKRVNKKD